MPMSWKMKVFWYLHIIFLPYLAIYVELVLYLLWGYFYSWVNMIPYSPWRSYTNYPPIV
jgi:hypothetical protein